MQSIINRWPWWIATLIGAFLPLYFAVPWFMEDPSNYFLFMDQAATTPAAQTVLVDVLWAALVFSIFVVVQAWRTKKKRLILAVLFTWTIGLSCGLPLYFALR